MTSKLGKESQQIRLNKEKDGNIIFDPGELPRKNLKAICELFGKKITLISERIISNDFSFSSNINIEQYPHVKSDYVVGYLDKNPELIWNKILDDHVSFMLFDRWYRNQRSNSLKVAYIIESSIKCQHFLESQSPQAIVFRAAPHSIFTWIFSRVADELEIPVIYFLESVLPWRFYLCRSRSKEPIINSPSDFSIGEDEHLLWDRYIQEKRGSADQALPLYEQKRLKINKGKHYNFLKDIQKNWKRPDLVLTKFLCFYTYKKLSVHSNNNEKYIVFFLHYQPERTTLPEGYGFAQQIAAIRILAFNLPRNFKILVKEHPSTFTNRCDWTQRTPGFYRNIVNIPNIELVSIEEDAYSLIDKSSAVATITGTVAFEALVRGTPAIVFGGGPLQLLDIPKFHRYSSPQNLQLFLSNLDKLETDEEWLRHYFNKVARESYSGWDGLQNLNDVKSYVGENNGKAIEIGLRDIHKII